MAGFIPAIHVLIVLPVVKTWMPGTMGLHSGRQSRTRVQGMTNRLQHLASLNNAYTITPYIARH